MAPLEKKVLPVHFCAEPSIDFATMSFAVQGREKTLLNFFNAYLKGQDLSILCASLLDVNYMLRILPLRPIDDLKKFDMQFINNLFLLNPSNWVALAIFHESYSNVYYKTMMHLLTTTQKPPSENIKQINARNFNLGILHAIIGNSRPNKSQKIQFLKTSYKYFSSVTKCSYLYDLACLNANIVQDLEGSLTGQEISYDDKYISSLSSFLTSIIESCHGPVIIFSHIDRHNPDIYKILKGFESAVDFLEHSLNMYIKNSSEEITIADELLDSMNQLTNIQPRFGLQRLKDAFNFLKIKLQTYLSLFEIIKKGSRIDKDDLKQIDYILEKINPALESKKYNQEDAHLLGLGECFLFIEKVNMIIMSIKEKVLISEVNKEDCIPIKHMRHN